MQGKSLRGRMCAPPNRDHIVGSPFPAPSVTAFTAVEAYNKVLANVEAAVCCPLRHVPPEKQKTQI